MIWCVWLVLLTFAEGEEYEKCPQVVRDGRHYLKTFNKTCYMFVNEEKFWDDARDYCWSQGGELVKIPNNETMTFLIEVLNSHELGWDSTGVWNGASDLRNRGWEWTTGEKLTWGFWDRGEPGKTLFISLENCALMRRSRGWQWHDFHCHFLKYHYNFICQFPFVAPNIQGDREASSAFEPDGKVDETGNYGQPCKNQSCNAPLKCLVDTCWCDVSYNWDSEKKTCRKLCLGTDAGLLRIGTFNEQYEMYKQRYTNCAYVEGNLELTFLEGDYDLQFLQSIEEVTGYVLIFSVWSNFVPLKNLRIIRGRTLYKYQSVEYALYIALNFNPKNNSQGIFELGFKNLTEITKGKVYFHNNNALCYENSIRWQNINPLESYQSVVFKSDTPYEKRPCGECHAACFNSVTKEKHCWGKGPDMCQKLNYGDVCSLSCEGRCFGSGQNQCCHPECAAGCHGPSKSECYACKTFYNDGMCETNCPAESIFDNGKLTWIKNPNAKYAYGSLCVKVCPEHLLHDQGACVVKCPDNKEPDVNNTACVECVGACKKTCGGTVKTDFVHQKNIQSFKDCTSIHGNLRIMKSTFDGDPFRNISGINTSDLQVFKNVTEITGYLAIQQTPSNLMDLSFLSNLEIIHGRDLSSGRFSVSLASMNITELGLKSLQHIKNGDVIIATTPNLCYLENISFSDIFSTQNQVLFKVNNKNASVCRAEGKVCDPECSQQGCWGPGPLNCIKCANKRVSENDQCVRLCSDLPLLYEDGDTCKKCDAQCADSCTGPGPSNCTHCKQVKFPGPDGISGVCMEKCPVLQKSPMYFYPDERNICQKCHYTCAEGCTGPSSEVRNGGCNTCELAINETLVDGTISCLPQEREDCPKGYYMTRLPPFPVSPLSRKNICQPCHALCLDCNGPDIGTCTECRFFKHFSLCVSECPNYTYPETSTKSCHQCDNECVEGSPICNKCDKIPKIDGSKPQKEMSTNQARAIALLSQGCMPLFPPSRRDWNSVPGEHITFTIGQTSIKWPPKGWEGMTPDRKLLIWEYTAMTLSSAKTGLQFPPQERLDLLDTFNFLALPGTATYHLRKKDQSLAKSRYYTYEVLRQVAKEGGEEPAMKHWLSILEKGAENRDISYDSLIQKTEGVTVRLDAD